MSVAKKSWGTAEGKDVFLFEMKNASGMTVNVTNYGGAIVSLFVPDKDGAFRDVVLGFDTLEGYFNNNPSLGVLVGRVANRIGKARFSLDGKEYILEKNDGDNHLHSGSKSFRTAVWDAAHTDNSIILTLFSPDGDSGYPGDVSVRVTYTLTDDNAFRIDYHAETETKTVCNLTNHSYFNLDGQNAGEIYRHFLQLNAGYVTAVCEDLIHTG
jgi:aldose 1-epimerase